MQFFKQTKKNAFPHGTDIVQTILISHEKSTDFSFSLHPNLDWFEAYITESHANLFAEFEQLVETFVADLFD